MRPVILREAVEGHHPLPVAAQGLDCLRIELLIAGRELIPQPLAFRAGLGVWNLAQQLLGCGPVFFRELVDHVDEPVIPTALLAGFGQDFAERRPDPQVPIGHCHLPRLIETWSGRMQAQCWLATGSRSYRPLIGTTPVPQSAPQSVSYILLYHPGRRDFPGPVGSEDLSS